MFERYKLVITHEMVLPDGTIEKIDDPLCAVYSVDRTFSKSPIFLNEMIDGFKYELLTMFVKESGGNDAEIH